MSFEIRLICDPPDVDLITASLAQVLTIVPTPTRKQEIRTRLHASSGTAQYWRERAYRAEHVHWDAELPPGGETCADCGQPVESEPCPDHNPAALLNQAIEDLTGARLSLWEEEQDAARLRVAARNARQRAARLRARVAELEARPTPAEVLRKAAAFLSEIGTPVTGERTEHEHGVMYAARRLAEQAEAAHRPTNNSRKGDR